MDMHTHLREHHHIDMHPDANAVTVNDVHHYDHTFNRPGHKLDEKLKAPPDAAAAQRAKSDQWRPTPRRRS